MRSLRVLHIWNTAGVASVIAKYMDRILGTRSLVVYRIGGPSTDMALQLTVSFGIVVLKYSL